MARVLQARAARGSRRSPAMPSPAASYGLVVTACSASASTRPVERPPADLIARINAFAGPVLALDVPSGLDGDTGRVLGVAVRATHTLSFIGGKPGLYTLDGPDHCGQVSVVELGLRLDECPGALLAINDFRNCLKPRPRNSHKGSYGSLAVIGGAAGMTGAALLAARPGLNWSARVRRPAASACRRSAAARTDAAFAGRRAGAGHRRRGRPRPRRVRCRGGAPSPCRQRRLFTVARRRRIEPARRPPGAGRTHRPPHAADRDHAASGRSRAAAGNHHRCGAGRPRRRRARNWHRRFKAHVALKGCGTVIAHPDGHWRINTTGNPGLASGGSGDVLTGMAGALLAQGWPAAAALSAAVHLHGAAADALAAGRRRPDRHCRRRTDPDRTHTSQRLDRGECLRSPPQGRLRRAADARRDTVLCRARRDIETPVEDLPDTDDGLGPLHLPLPDDADFLAPSMRLQLIATTRPVAQVVRALMLTGTTGFSMAGFSMMPLAESARVLVHHPAGGGDPLAGCSGNRSPESTGSPSSPDSAERC